MTYEEAIKQLKEHLHEHCQCSGNDDLDKFIDRAASLGLSEGKRIQHEEDVEAINTKVLECNPGGGSCKDSALEALASLSPGEEGNKE